MSIDKLNETKRTIFIDSHAVQEITMNGELGLYKLLFMDDNVEQYIYEKDKYECSEEEIYNYIRKRLDILKRKYTSFKLYIMSNEIDKNFINLLSIIPVDTPIIIELISINNTDISLINKIVNESNSQNIFIKLNTREYTPEAFVCILNTMKKDKLVKYEYDLSHYKDIYKRDTIDTQKDRTFAINNTDDIKVVLNELQIIRTLFQKNLINTITINIMVTDISFFKNFYTIISKFDSNEGWPSDKITYNLNVENIEDQINYLDTSSFRFINSNIQIYSEGVQYSSYGEFQFFHNFTKFILSRIPEYATELEKVTYICKFIVEYYKYDYENFEKLKNGTGDLPDKSLYVLAVTGIGVCCDYAHLTQHLLNKVGIKCDYISSESYDYENDKNIPGKIHRSPITGRITDTKYMGHAFNIVHINNKPYFLDNTWIKKGTELFRSEHYLVSTDTFRKTHSKYVEVDKKECPEDYSRYDILMAERSAERILSYLSNEEQVLMYGTGQSLIADTIRNLKN